MRQIVVLFLFILASGCVAADVIEIPPEINESQETIDQEIPQNYETLYVSLGEEFTLHYNQSAIIKDENLEIKIIGFINSPCQEGLQCFWSGLGIHFEYTKNGEVKKELQAIESSHIQTFGYKTKIIDSDYKTYANLMVTKIE